MKIQGRHSFRAPRDIVWRALLDQEVLAKTLPGCEGLQADGHDTFRGTLNVKIGPVQGRFKGSVEISDRVEPERFTIAIDGQGAPGFLDGKGTVQLETEDGGTALLYDLDTQVGGRVASIGQRLLDSTARAITKQALEGLERQIEAMQAAATSEAPVVPVEAPSRTRFTAAVARDIAADLGVRRSRVGAIILVIVIIAALIVLWWFVR